MTKSLRFGNPGWRLFWRMLPFVLSPLSAQSVVSHIEHLGTGDGLSHPSVYAILQDDTGYLWFCTENGLNRFDGYQFKAFYHHPHDPSTLSSNSVSAILQEEDGRFWMGTWGGGLNRYDPGEEGFRSYRADVGDPESLSSDFVQTLFLSKDNTLWVGTLDGVNRFDRSRGLITQYRGLTGEGNLLTGGRIWCFAEDPDGRLWIGRDHGLVQLDPNTDIAERFTPSRPGRIDLHNVQIRRLCLDRFQRLWVGTSHGLARIQPRSGEVEYFSDPRGPGGGAEINALYEDRVGRIWVGTHFDGLWFWNQANKSFAPVPIEHPTSSADKTLDVRAIFEDLSENLWVGMRRDGIFRLDLKQQKFRLRKTGELIPPSGVSTMLEDAEGGFWLGSTEQGLTRWNRQTDQFERFRHERDDTRTLSHDHVTSLALDAERRLWVGTLGGLNRWNKGRRNFERVPLQSGDGRAASNDRVFALLVDDTGVLWVGGEKGVFRYNGESFRHFRHIRRTPGSLAKGWIHCLHQGRSRTIWLGSRSGGLSRYDPAGESFTTFSHDPQNPNTISNDAVLSLMELGGYLWVGTAEGLNRLDPETSGFRLFTVQDGLDGNAVYAIENGGNGMLWLSTNRGLSRFDIHSETFRNYGPRDGLQGEQFFRGSSFRSARGELFFGGPGGINSFFPAEVRDHFFRPQVAITRFQALDRELALGELERPFELDDEDNLIQIEFAAFDYTNPGNHRFDYKLEGYDRDWVSNGASRKAVYAKLPPGEYRFHLRATNHDGVAHEYNNLARLRVGRPWHASAWAVAVLGLLALSLGLGAMFLGRRRKHYRSRVEELEKIKRQAVLTTRSRSAFLTNMSHELRTPLNAIIGYSEILAEELEDVEVTDFDVRQCLEDLAKIKSSAYYQLAQVNNLMELAKIDGGKGELFLETFDIRDMVGLVLDHIHPMLEKTGNTLNVKYIPEGIGAMVADLVKVQGILLNLLTNANKFTQQGDISLVVMRMRESGSEVICFKVKDTGIGIPAENVEIIFDEFTTAHGSTRYEGPGLGLYISKHFSQMMGGHIGVESQVSLGATFSVYLPAVVTPDSKIRVRHSSSGSGRYSAQTIF